MPAYNGERYIRQAIDSVLSQTYSAWELIVVDDGSVDNTAEIVASFQDKRIIYVHQENRGQAAALNRGLDMVRGEYVTTLDADDWYTPNSLQDRAVFLDSHPQYDVVYGDGIFCDVDGNKIKNFSEMHLGNVTGDVFDVLLSNAFYGTGASVMVRVSALRTYNIRYDESIVWCQDYDIYLRLAENCEFGYVDSLMIWYRLHKANMTMTMKWDHRIDSLVRVKFRAMASARFAEVSESYRYLFFRNLVLNDLDNRIEEQMALLDHPEFLRLTKHDQAMLIRLLAAGYLAVNKHLDEVKILITRSLKLNLFDLKTISILFFAHFQGGPIAPLFRYWQSMKIRKSFEPSPFDQIKE